MEQSKIIDMLEMYQWAQRASSGAPPWPPGCLLRKKSPKSFAAFGLRLVLILCEVKKQAKNSYWHWPLCQQVSPKK